MTSVFFCLERDQTLTHTTEGSQLKWLAEVCRVIIMWPSRGVALSIATPSVQWLWFTWNKKVVESTPGEQISRLKVYSHWEWKCKNCCSCSSLWKMDGFTSNQHQNDQRPILHISCNIFHQWKCFVFV